MWNASSSDACAQYAARKKFSPKQVFVKVLELCVLFSLFRRLELCNYVCRPQSPCWPQTTILSHNLKRVTDSTPFRCVSQFPVLAKWAKQNTHFCCVSLGFTVFLLCFTVFPSSLANEACWLWAKEDGTKLRRCNIDIDRKTCMGGRNTSSWLYLLGSKIMEWHHGRLDTWLKHAKYFL